MRYTHVPFYPTMLRPVVLIVLDGWGLSDAKSNILNTTKLPTITKLDHYYPMIALQASGISVGLPWGETGNSEVGHMTMGAGRIIYQDLPRITLAIQDESFFENKMFKKAINRIQESGGALHIMGLLSSGAVHAHREHLYALLDLAVRNNVSKVYIHVITDGRDSSPTSGVRSIEKLQDKIKEIGVGKIASIIGRNWTMDRNNNWERVQKGYDLLVKGTGEQITDPISFLKDSYKKNVTDEFIEPAVITEDGKPLATIKNGDALIFYNYRSDRARQITKAFVLPGFEKFDRGEDLDIEYVAMTEYEKDLPVDIAFPPEDVHHTLGEELSINGKRQFRLAETEKYAHVTYFFNGGAEDPWLNEERALVPSPAVDRFDQAPEMNAAGITQKLVEAVRSNLYDFILVNYANADMVAHTGNEDASRIACITIDQNLAVVIPTVLKAGGCLLITADHGNVEVLKNPQTGEVDTKHNASPVPLWYITPNNHREKTPAEIQKGKTKVHGLLSDIAPTILEIMTIPKPEEMHGESLLSSMH